MKALIDMGYKDIFGEINFLKISRLAHVDIRFHNKADLYRTLPINVFIL